MTLLSRHKEKSCFENNLILNGAGNESRTRDLNLGKVALYQLSYSRISEIFAGSKEAAIIAASLRLSSIVSEFI